MMFNKILLFFNIFNLLFIQNINSNPVNLLFFNIFNLLFIQNINSNPVNISNSMSNGMLYVK